MRISAQLEPDEETLGLWLDRLKAFALTYLKGSPRHPAYVPMDREPQYDTVLPKRPQPFEQVLEEFKISTLEIGLNPSSGGFFGYVPGGGLPTAAIGDFIAAITNRYSGVYLASPGATAIENLSVKWLSEMIEYPPESWGVLTSGGTLATLAAVVAARETRSLAQWASSTFYATGEVHQAVAKSLKTAGLAHVPMRRVNTDDRFRMSVDHLKDLVETDLNKGLQPWMVFASAGTVNTGAVDPLDEIAAYCRERGLWLHVDAAYGGFFTLTSEGRKKLAGLNRADSLVLDPHKGLFLPYGTGAVLVRNGKYLKEGFAFEADYLEDVRDYSHSSPADYSPELTRHFRALRLWFSLKLNGIERFRAALEEKLILARYAHDRLLKIPALELGPKPQLSCVTFRVGSENGDAATKNLNRKILNRGHVYFSTTRLYGKLYLRMCILCFRSRRAEVDLAISEIEKQLI